MPDLPFANELPAGPDRAVARLPRNSADPEPGITEAHLHFREKLASGFAQRLSGNITLTTNGEINSMRP